MAVAQITLYRNATSTDTTLNNSYYSNQNFPSATDLSWSVDSKVITEWNTARDGNGSGYSVGSSITFALNDNHGVTTYYAIWGTIDVTITYQGSPIATMSGTGIKTLQTSQTFCEDDIIVSYTKPSAPAPTLQAKTNIAPSTSSQTITPDSGYDGLSSVQINAMPSGSARTPTSSIYASTSYYIDEWGTLMISASGSQQITPTVTAGYVSSGTAGTVTAYSNDTFDLTSDGYAFDGTVDDYEEEEEEGGGGA